MAIFFALLALVLLSPVVIVAIDERREKTAHAISRCEFQHRCLMDGHTDLGTYGLYPPADL